MSVPGHRLSLTIALCLSVAGCGAGDPDGGSDVDGGVGATDAGPRADADPTAPDASSSSCGVLPSHTPSWLSSMQDDIVARLSGESAITPGVFLADRASASRRATARDYIADQFTALGFTPELDNYGTGTNVYAELAATNGSNEYVVVGAHFDSVPSSPGANDNATGVAMVLALARYLSAVQCRSMNVIFVLFDQEEIGLVGSQNFASLLVSAGLDVHSVHTIDQMGWDNDSDRAFELERPDTGLYGLYAAAKSSGGFSMPIHQTNTGSTDHVSFRERGFEAIGITEEYVNGDTTPHYHRSSDTYGTVNFSYLASTTQLLLYTFGSWLHATSAAVLAPVSPAWNSAEVRRRRVVMGPVPGWQGCRAAHGLTAPATR